MSDTILCLALRGFVKGLVVILPQSDSIPVAKDTSTNPIPLEAILRAEIAVFNAQFQTRRASQGPRIVFTVCAETLSFGWRL